MNINVKHSMSIYTYLKITLLALFSLFILANTGFAENRIYPTGGSTVPAVLDSTGTNNTSWGVDMDAAPMYLYNTGTSIKVTSDSAGTTLAPIKAGTASEFEDYIYLMDGVNYLTSLSDSTLQFYTGDSWIYNYAAGSNLYLSVNGSGQVVSEDTFVLNAVNVANVPSNILKFKAIGGTTPPGTTAQDCTFQQIYHATAPYLSITQTANGNINLNTSGTGVTNATALTTNVLNVDNLSIDANTISSTTGKIILAPLSGQDLDLTPAGVGNVNITANDLEVGGTTVISSARAATFTGITSPSLTIDSSNLTLSTTTSGNIVLNPFGFIDCNSKLISNVLDPVSDQDVVTKKYFVDNSSSGGYTVDTITMTGTITYNPATMANVLKVIPNGANRTISLVDASGSNGDTVDVTNISDADDLYYVAIGSDQVYAGGKKQYIHDGTKWVSNFIGTNDGVSLSTRYNCAVGAYSHATGRGTAYGSNSIGDNYGSGFGLISKGTGYSFAGGAYAHANSGTSNRYNNAIGGGKSQTPSVNRQDEAAYVHSDAIECTAIGTDTYVPTGLSFVNILGAHGKANKSKQLILGGDFTVGSRYGEQKTSSDNTNKYSRSIVTFYGSTANATPVELSLDATSEKLTIEANSSIAFYGQAIARDNVANHKARYYVEGSCSRDGANNTTCDTAITTKEEGDAAWDLTMAADDTAETLDATFTGDDTNPTQIMLELEIQETRF